MEDGGCAVLFRSPRSRLLGVPNALLGVTLYALLAIGLLAHWPAWLLFVMTLPAIAMSIVLGYSLITPEPAVPHLLDRACRQRDPAGDRLCAASFPPKGGSYRASGGR